MSPHADAVAPDLLPLQPVEVVGIDHGRGLAEDVVEDELDGGEVLAQGHLDEVAHHPAELDVIDLLH